MTHEQLCERARSWLARSMRCNPVFSKNASCSEIPDAIGWSSLRGSIVVECKTSVSDFYADKHKYEGWKDHERNCIHTGGRWRSEQAKRFGWELVELPRMGDYRYFMCPPDVIAEELVEKHAKDHGLLYAKGRIVRVVRQALKRDNPHKDAEIRYLRFCIINRKIPYRLTCRFAADWRTDGHKFILAGESVETECSSA